MANRVANNALWQNRSFSLLWCGTILSAMADGAFFILLSWFIVDVTGSEAMLGTTLICMSIPRLLFMLAGGVAADRWNRKWIMFVSILARGLILVGFSLLLMNQHGSFLPIFAYVLAVLFGTVDAFFWPARSSILPSLVSREQLAPANSMMEISQQISMVGGPVVSALLIKTTTYPVMFLILGIAFFAGTLFILSLRLNPSAAETDSGDREPTSSVAKTSYLKDITGGIRYTFSVPILCIILVTSLFTNMMFSGPINMGIPLHVKDLGWDGSSYSSLSLSLGIGTIVGGILTGLCKGFRGRFLILPVILGIMGVGMSSLFFMQQLTFGLIAMFLIGMTLTITNIPLLTYIQTIVPANVLGRVMSLLSLMSIGFGPISYALCSFLLEAKLATPGLLLFIGGIIFTCIGLSLLLIPPFRKMEEHPAWKRTSVQASEAKASLSS